MQLQKVILIVLFVLLSTGCNEISSSASPDILSSPTISPEQEMEVSPVSTLPSIPEASLTPSQLPVELMMSPEDWKSWPVQPLLTRRVAEIYQLGQELGNDPHAFSVFGDCQSKPGIFLGIFETDPSAVSQLSGDLKETVANFVGSFNRESPTIRDAMTAGGLLNPEWHGGYFDCQTDETPVECELRIHRPSFVFINVGTHWVTRNQQYLQTIIQQLIDHGVVPILATKADDRYQGEKTNQALAILAVEFDVPLWNFWAEALTLPDHGVYTMIGQGGLGDVYLTEQALALYRLSALQALDKVWRAAIAGD